MAMSEPADFVHIFDANANYQRSQEIDVFGALGLGLGLGLGCAHAPARRHCV
jgi:hypothetical protein